MNAWAKRGLKAAFFTGGMLVLGAGIASANECCPDRPTPPLAPSVSIPVHICDNVIGAPGGPYDTPCIHETLTTDQVLSVMPQNMPMPDVLGEQLRGNRGHANLVVPVDVSGNAFALGEDAEASGSSEFVYQRPDPVYTDGAEGFFAGNVVAGDAVVPLVATGNAFGILGNAYSDADSTTDVSSGGDIYTDGSYGPFAGNVVAPLFAVPFQASGNGVGAVGTGEATGRHSLTTTSGGDIGTTGQDNLLSGNVAAAAMALPFQVNGNGLAGAGEGYSSAEATTVTTSGGDIVSNGDPAQGAGNIVAPSVAGPAQLAGNAGAVLAQAETTGTGSNTTDAGGDYATSGTDSLASGNIADPAVALPVQGLGNAVAGGAEAWSYYGSDTTSNAGGQHSTDGNSGIGSGNVLAAPVAGPAQLAGNAVAGAGQSETDTAAATETNAAGDTATNGDDSVVGGAVADTPVALPVLGYGNAAAGVGAANARHSNEVTPTAGGDSYTRGDGSLAGGAMASTPVGGPAELFGNAAAAGGDSVAAGRNTAITEAGGFQGTRGSDSVAGGNLVQAPAAIPFQVMGNAAAGAATARASASNNKDTKAGGPPTTNDDAGLLASNVVHPALSGPLEVFGNAAGGAAEVTSNVDSTSDITAGGPAIATGTGGTGSGNVAHAPFAMPTQLFGDVATVAAWGESTTSNDATSTAGGDVTSDGTDGVVSGNVANAGMAGVSQALGAAAAGLGEADTATTNDTDALSGGSIATAGTGGFVSGNVGQVPTVAAPQPLGDAVAGAAESESAVASDTTLDSGGPVATDGDGGVVAGNIASVPAGALAQPFADAVSGIGAFAGAEADNTTAGTAGGATSTGGEGFLTGIDGQVPVGAVVQPYDFPVEVLAQAETTASNSTSLVTGEAGPVVNLPLSGDGVPSLSLDRSFDRSHGVAGPLGGLPLVGELDGLGLPAVGSMPSAPSLPGLDGGLPVVGELADGGLPFVGGPLGGGLPVADALGAGLPADLPMDGVSAVDGGLPVVGGLPDGGLPTGDLTGGGLPLVGGLTGGLPMGDLTGGGLPLVGGLTGGGLPAADLAGGGLPVVGGLTGGLAGGGLPVGDLAGGGLPVVDGGLPVVGGGLPVPGLEGGLPGFDDGLPGMHAVPVVGDGGFPLMDSDLPMLDGGLPVDGGLPAVDGVSLPSADGVSLPVVGGLPGLDGGLPVVGGDLPAVGGGLPVVGGDLPVVGGDLPMGGSGVEGGIPFVGSLGGGIPFVGGFTGFDGGLPVVGDLADGGLPVVGGGVSPLNGAPPLDGASSVGRHGVRDLDRADLPSFDGVSLPGTGGFSLPGAGGLPVFDGGVPGLDLVSLPFFGGLSGMGGTDLPLAESVPAVSGMDALPNAQDLPLPSLPRVPSSHPVPMPTPVDLPGELPAFDSLGGADMLRMLTDGLPTSSV